MHGLSLFTPSMYASPVLILGDQMILSLFVILWIGLVLDGIVVVLRLFVMVVLWIGLMGRTNQTTPDDPPVLQLYSEEQRLQCTRTNSMIVL